MGKGRSGLAEVAGAPGPGRGWECWSGEGRVIRRMCMVVIVSAQGPHDPPDRGHDPQSQSFGLVGRGVGGQGDAGGEGKQVGGH